MILYGFVNIRNSFVAEKKEMAEIEFKVDEDSEEYEQLYLITKDTLNGYINENGEVIVETKYIYSLEFSEGLAFVSNESNNGYIDHTGNEAITYQEMW